MIFSISFLVREGIWYLWEEGRFEISGMFEDSG